MAKLAGRERLEPVGDEEAHAALEAAARDLLSFFLSFFYRATGWKANSEKTKHHHNAWP